MKLTEEHLKAIDKAFPQAHSTPGTRRGAKWAIEKFGGIQWNRYPEVKPTDRGSYLILTAHGWAEGHWDGESWLQFRWSLMRPNVTHWAEINLPNLKDS